MHSTPPSAPLTWSPGMLIPGTSYRVLRPIGYGGMGEVYEAENDMLGKRVAIKVLARDCAGRKDLEERLRAEAKTLARLSHPNLVEVFDLKIASDKRIFFVMELLDGRTLRDWLYRSGKLSPEVAVHVMAQALDGLAAAHSTQLVHRDFKPENVFLCSNGTTKLLDFGIYKAIDASTEGNHPVTRRGVTLGTPWYMAPEQAAGRPVDRRADIYAAGLVLWEALSGRRAFGGDDAQQILNAKAEGTPPLDPRLGVPEALAAAIARACSPDPDDRFVSAAEFAAEIRRAVGEVPPPWAMARTHGVAAHPSQPPLPTTTRIMGSSFPTLDEHLRAETPPDAVMTELTEALGACCPVDRDAPTRTSLEQLPSATGPSGTAMLPAVAAQHAPPAVARQATQPASIPAPPSLQGAPPNIGQSVPDHQAEAPPTLTGWLKVFAAFVIPVSIAAGIGLFVLRNTGASSSAPAPQASATMGPADSSAPARSTSSAPEAPVATEAAPAQSSAAEQPSTASTSSKNQPKTAQPVASSTAAAPTAPLVTTVKAADSTRPAAAAPPAKKTARPASGL